MLSKKIILIFPFILLLLSLFSGCIFEDIVMGGSSFELKNWSITEKEGFTSLFLDFKCDEKVFLKTYSSNGKLIDTEYFYGSDTAFLDIGSYRETIHSKKVLLKVFNEKEKIVEDKTKEFSFTGPDIDLVSSSFNVWKKNSKTSLIELKFVLFNNGDTPVYPEKMKVTYDGEIYEGLILPCTIIPGSSKEIYSFIYIEDIDMESSIDLEILDKSSLTLFQRELTFDDIDYCETASYTAGLDSRLLIPVPDYLYSYYNSKELIVDDYSAFVLDIYDEEYIDLFIELFIDNLIYSDYFDSFNDPKKINEVANFIQRLDYIPDYEEGEEETEDPQYPIETLFRNNWKGGGDCEDKAILIANVLKNMGYNVSLLRIPNHMAVGVELSEEALPEYDYYVDNYYFLDTSPEELGKIYSKYKDPSELDIYPANNRAFIDHFWKNGTLTIYTDSNNKKSIKVVVYIDNLGNKKACDLELKAIFYTVLDIEIDEESFGLTDIEPYSRIKKVISLDVPSGISSKFDTRIYMDNEEVSKKSSKSIISN